MFHLPGRKLALAFALLAVAGSSVLPSESLAFAASTPPTEAIRYTVEQVPPKPKPTFIVPATPTTFTAALKVTPVSSVVLPDGNGTNYNFMIVNGGLNSSGPITLEQGWWWSTTLGGPINGHLHPAVIVPGLAPGESQPVTLPCNEPGWTVCSGGGIRVSAPNDITPGDNFANIGLAIFP